MSADIPDVSWGQHGPSSRTDDSDASCEGASRAPKRYHSGCSEDMCFHLTQLKRKQDLAFSPVCLRGVHCRPHLGQNLAQPPFLGRLPTPHTLGPQLSLHRGFAQALTLLDSFPGPSGLPRPDPSSRHSSGRSSTKASIRPAHRA